MMEKLMYALIRPVLFSMDPENAHEFTMKSMKLAGATGLSLLNPKAQASPRKVMGLTFPNPVGLAAGLDKNGSAIDGIASLGFGFIELGTVTPRPQPGNPKPRMFRIPAAEAIINRMGFNNAGVDVLVSNVKASRYFRKKEGILGLNIGKNADTPIERAADDYLICLQKVYPVADYIAINISSPNTKDLRQLQGESELDDLLSQIKDMQMRLADSHSRYVPLALKIAPDVDNEQVKRIAATLLQYRIDGVIATNTTVQRDLIKNLKHAEEAGGLSGAPVRDLSTHVVRLLKSELGDEIPIIGVGGIMNSMDAREKTEAGASLIQLLTGMVYRGPALVKECVRALG
ncbi:MAG: quinone-dependent dihydroorotate dehydrogenase [Burkholderiaceae bacterium]|jgi:dihydroorotate dehydrogenase|nr:quinone-dependent dihydroorotate dehydrogenase [Burkholderiaceae bacterium]